MKKKAEQSKAKTPGNMKATPQKRVNDKSQTSRQRNPGDYTRAFSSPNPRSSHEELSKHSNVLRSFSSPDPKDPRYLEQRRNSDPYYRHWIFSEEFDSDPEVCCEQLEEALLDVDNDSDQSFFGSYGRGPEPVPTPRKVTASLIPGSGVQKLKSTSLAERRADRKDDNAEKPSTQVPRIYNFRPLVLKMPARSSGKQATTMLASPEICHIDSDEHLEREPMEVIPEFAGDEVRTGESNALPEVLITTPNSHLGVPEFTLDGAGFKNNSGSGTDMASMMENLKKNSLLRQNQTKVTSSASQQMVSSSTKSSSSASSQRLQASSQRRQHIPSADLKVRSDLSEFSSSISEMKKISQRMRRSMENIVDRDDGEEARQLPDIRDIGDMSDIGDISDIGAESPLVTFPDADTPPIIPAQNLGLAVNNSTTAVTASSNEMKYSSAHVSSASSSRLVTDSFSSMHSDVNSAQVRRLQHGELSYEERVQAARRRNMLQAEGLRAQQNTANLQEQRSLKAGDLAAAESRNMSASSMKLQTEAFSSEASAISAAAAHQTLSSGRMHHHHESVAHSNMTITSKNMSSKSSMLSSNSQKGIVDTTRPGEEDLSGLSFDDLDKLGPDSTPKDVEQAILKYSSKIDAFMKSLSGKRNLANAVPQFDKLNEIVKRAWAVPAYGHELGYSLCNTLRTSGGLEILLSNCDASETGLKFASAKLLEQCLTTENRAHVVENGLETVVNVACACTKQLNTDHARVGTGILEHLFKHSEGACGDVVKLGGLDAVLFECRKNDVETLRHCASALANLSLYGGAENQEAMIKRKVPMWLFPLAFHTDDNVKYYACLAIAVLVANKEIEAAVLKSGTLDLVEPFVTSHNPSEFAQSNLAYAHGQSKDWLRRLVPVLSSKREEARNLAAFHFCMEAGIKERQGNTEIFREIGAVESLKKVASCPNAVASKYAAQALRLIGEEVPHKLSQQVPLWSTEDVREWVKQIGFSEYANNFVESRVDGDLLLQLTEENLKEDIGLSNGIKRIRFTRELHNLKKMADYSSRDSGNLHQFLQSIGQEYTIYTYSMLNAGVDKDSMRGLSDDHLDRECRIKNGIHRLRILNHIKTYIGSLPSTSEENLDKSLDVFVSYRRSNGSQLASLLKVHLELRGFTVFIDVERLEAGKFDNNLLQSIKQAKHFLLVLTPSALDRCKQDQEQKDWVHREIVAALQSNCNIIPIIDNFEWPEPEDLPEDMRPVCHFNGVRWIHDYQDACVEKLERFLRGELTTRSESRLKEMNTPVPMNRGPPNYQRMASQESRGSDKDGNGSTCSRE